MVKGKVKAREAASASAVASGTPAADAKSNLECARWHKLSSKFFGDEVLQG